ncbi:glycosyltransferase family 9 protein [Mesorhizobium sp. M0408]|uniref:glycosyltransferase family 9 protein n=1 Tax=Mesorhizobium sp. M0408 TaxID=2956942 RepID=UPI00333B56E4
MKLSAVFFANGLGDYLLTLPTLRALARALPTRLALITSDGPSELLFGDVGIDRVVSVPMWRPGASAARCFSASQAFHELGPVECLISLVPWHSASLAELARLVRPAWSIGLHRDFDFCVLGDARDHAADLPFNVVRKFAPHLQISDFAHPFALPPESVAAAEDVRRAIGANRRLLVVHEETATEAKQWLPSRMHETLRVLTARHPDLFIVVASRHPPSFPIETLGEAAISITRISLSFFLALIARADSFVGVDSIGLHVADLWSIPAIGLFGPTRPEEWGFRFSDKGVHLDGRGSMHNISVEQVVSAFSSLQMNGARQSL